jgi:putative phage-type endonuclease
MKNIEQVIDRIILKNDINIYEIDEKNIIFIYNIVKYINNIYVTENDILKRFEQIKSNKKILEKLKKIPQMKQRSEEWYNARKNMITASDMAQALNEGKFGNQKELMIKKINNLRNIKEENKSIEYIAPLQWGIKYEDVACSIYESKNNTKIIEFGLLKHYNKDITYFGASPDGISELGVMLEIKCPYKREINGVIPNQYYYQIQGQLDVCNLEECDYLECKFVEYKTEEDFINDKIKETLNLDNINSLNENKREKGIIICYKNIDETKMEYKYLYSNLNDSEEEMITWKKNKIMNFDIDTDYEINYWKLDRYEVQRVKRDKKFIKEKLDQINLLWKKIEYYSNSDNYEEYKKDILLNKKSKIIEFNKNVNTIPDIKELKGFCIRLDN